MTPVNISIEIGGNLLSWGKYALVAYVVAQLAGALIVRALQLTGRR